MTWEMCNRSVLSHTMSRPDFLTLQEQGEISAWDGQICDVCARLTASTRHSNHISRHASERPCSLIFRTAPRFPPRDTTSVTTADPAGPSFVRPPFFRVSSCRRTLSLSVPARAPLAVLPRAPSSPSSCTSAALLLGLRSSHTHYVRSATVYRYTESANRTTPDKFLLRAQPLAGRGTHGGVTGNM